MLTVQQQSCQTVCLKNQNLPNTHWIHFPKNMEKRGENIISCISWKKNALSGWWWCKMHPKTTNEVHHHLLGEMWGNSEREKNVGEITFQGGIFPTMLPFSARIHLVRLFSKLQAGARRCMVCTVKSNSVSVRLMRLVRSFLETFKLVCVWSTMFGRQTFGQTPEVTKVALHVHQR